MFFWKRCNPSLVLTITFVLLSSMPAIAQTPGMVGAFSGDPSPRVAGATLDPKFQFNNAAHVASGVALRNATEGWIHLRGVPRPNAVIRAFLYWNLADNSLEGPATWRATFNGHVVEGVKVADSDDACWGNVGNHTYRANVTAFVPKRRPNGFYNVVIDFDSETTTSGQNPWDPTEFQSQRLNGATLIVVYADTGTVMIYDDLNDSMFSATGTFTLDHPGFSNTLAHFTMTGADGQRGGGHDNSGSNETTTFAGIQIAGPPVAASDWDGSAGWPLVQLWDVHTHIVQLDNGLSTVEYTAGSDCLVPVAFAIGTL